MVKKITHMSDNNINEKMQYAYRPNHSTEQALAKLNENIPGAQGYKCDMFLVMRDLSAA